MVSQSVWRNGSPLGRVDVFGAELGLGAEPLEERVIVWRGRLQVVVVAEVAAAAESVTGTGAVPVERVVLAEVTCRRLTVAAADVAVVDEMYR